MQLLISTEFLLVYAHIPSYSSVEKHKETNAMSFISVEGNFYMKKELQEEITYSALLVHRFATL
jgi:hypothetical protein